MKKKRFSWIMLIALWFSIFAPFAVPQAAKADTIDSITTELAKAYQFMDSADATAINAAGTAVAGLTNAQWDTIVNPLLTQKAVAKFSNEAAAKAAMIQFAKGMGGIYYSTDSTGLRDKLTTFKTNNSSTFIKLFGNTTTVDTLYNFLIATKGEFAHVIQTDSSLINKLAFGNNTTLINAIPALTKTAMTNVVNTNPYSGLKGSLDAIDWNQNMLADQQTAIAAAFDINRAADIALAKAAVRSESKLAQAITTPVTVALNAAVPHDITIMGKNATNYLEWQSSNSNVVSVTKNATTGNYVITAVGNGVAKLIAYRDVDVNNPAAAGDWLFKYDVAVGGGVFNSNANLASLSPSAGVLVPAFDPAVTDYKVILPAAYNAGVPTITATLADNTAKREITPAGSLAGTTTVKVIAQNSTTSKTYNVTFVKNTEVVVAAVTNITGVSASNQNFEVPAGDLSGVQMSMTIPAEATQPTIKFVPTSDAGGIHVAMPELNVSAARDVGAVTVAVPVGTTVTAPAGSGWDGTIVLPTVKAQASAAVGGSAVVVLEVGAGKDASGNDIVLTFSKAVRLLVPGQAGKTAAYTRNGSLVSITRTLTADTQAVADASIPAEGEAAINVGNDKAIWTKHFTEFVAYTPTPSGGGGGGGSSAAFSGTTVSASSGGTVSESGVSIVIPANAVVSDIKVKIEKIAVTNSLPLPAQSKFISDVLEITKDKSADFTKAVTITLAFDKTKVDTSKYDIGIYYLDTNTNKWVKLDNVKLDATVGSVSGDVTHFTKFAVIATEKAAVTPPVVNLTDIAGNWAEANILKLVAAGAVSGYTDGTFKPTNTITRAEFATILVKAFKLAPKDGKIFTDTADNWAKVDIATANAYGIVNGYSDGRFGPNDLITREQVAIMVVKAANLSQAIGGKTFTDAAEISAWAKDAVAIASQNGLISGYTDNTFKPQGNASRAEAVTIIVKAMK